LLGLDELEQDALTELVNIGVSRAAVGLSTMAGEEVLLTVPAISAVSPAEAAELIGGSALGPLLAVEESFEGDITGRAFLIFPEASSLELVRAVSGESLGGGEAAELAAEALCETGNVVLQTCLSTIANMLHRTLTIGVPHLVRASAAELFPSNPKAVVLFVYINFRLRGRRIRGYIALLMDLPSQDALKGLLAEFIARETG
jgi:chemotaxis protein CheC